MTKKLISLLIVTLFLVSVMVLTATAKSRVTDLRSEKLSHYGFLFDKKANVVGTNEFASPGKEIPQQSLGISGDGNTPGVVIGHSWYDYQCNSSTTRQIDWRNPNPQIHMAFTQIFAVGGKRYVTYNVYDPISGTWPLGADIGCPVSPPSGDAEGRAGFTSMDIRPDGGAVIACHHSADNNGTDYSTAVYIDQTASSGIYCGFGQGSHAPNSLAEFAAQEPNPAEYSWPKIEYHINGNDTVIYALSVEAPDNTSLEQTMVLFRNAGSSLQSTWEAFVIDTVFFSLHNLTASRLTRKVAICYLDRAPENIQGNNDVYYLVSQDMGATWNLSNKVNVTNYQVDEVGYRAWLELSCLYDSNDNLHLVWNANLYNGDGQGTAGRNCRLFHWAENTDIISTIQNAEWDPSRVCGVAGSNVFNVAKFTISECNGRLYVIWNQWGDPDNGDSTDCADPNLSSAATNANAEIYLSVSSDLDGILWDAPRNLTNTKTPNCDSTSGNECGNETWPFMSRYGMNNSQWSGLDWLSAGDAYEVDPSADPPYTGNYYLDVLYVNDVIPGPAANTGGNNTSPDYYVPLLWFRLPCVEPVVEPRLVLSPINIFYPNYTQHGEATSYNIRVENAGNADLDVSKVFVQKTTYTSSNWLVV
ncbi:MAG: hypothetical protein PHN52_08845, partial [candidate division Zixibacteria bacterium]|nr:hypothetical protein [candidate division Zixibacteria bacterium]